MLEDLRPDDDVTGQLIKNKKKFKAKIISNQKGIIGGLNFAKEAFKYFDFAKTNIDERYNPYDFSIKTSPISVYYYLGKSHHLNYNPDSAIHYFNKFIENYKKHHTSNVLMFPYVYRNRPSESPPRGAVIKHKQTTYDFSNFVKHRDIIYTSNKIIIFHI